MDGRNGCYRVQSKIISGNSVEIKKMTLKEGWKSNGKIKPEIIPANTTKSGKLRVVGVGDFLYTFQYLLINW